ncbi:MAG: hypothetical protein RL148_509 [Planctomycetota bacterium]
MNISALSLSLTRPGGGVSAPPTPEQLVAALFSNGEQGAWYDPSDRSTLFQDSAGTLPVTEVEQPVGLMLDRRKGLALGSELVTNGGFSSATGWTTGTNWSISGGLLTSTGSNTNALVSQTGTLTGLGGKWVQVTAVVSAYTSGNFRVLANGTGSFESTMLSGAGTRTAYVFVPSNTDGTFYIRSDGGSAFVGSIDSISVKLLDGNHAYQTTSSARPHLRSRYNLLTYSEQLDNAAWTKQGYVMTANTVVAPDGTTTAETAADNTTSTFHWFRQDITVTAGSTYTFSAYLKYNDQRYVGLAFFSTAVNNVDRVLLLDMTQTDPAQMVVQQDAGVTSNIQSVGNGWYRVSMTFTMLSAGTLWYLIVSSNTNSYPVSYSGTGKSVYVWGAQLNLGSTAMSYQRIAALPALSTPPTYATTSTMGGEVFRPYLFFDGADSLLTANIDMSATDEVTVSAGLRKLSDATQGALVEFSSSANNAGAFGLICPVATTPADNLVFRSTGTTAIRDALTSGYPAPTDPLVLSGIGDVGSNVCQVRVNAVLKTSNTSSQGATNYLNAPLYIGSRNNASTYYNGNIYALIVRGKTSTAGELASLESYVASKTGVTL